MKVRTWQPHYKCNLMSFSDSIQSNSRGTNGSGGNDAGGIAAGIVCGVALTMSLAVCFVAFKYQQRRRRRRVWRKRISSEGNITLANLARYVWYLHSYALLSH